MNKQSLIVFFISILLIFFIKYWTVKQQESFFNIDGLYSPTSAISNWRNATDASLIQTLDNSSHVIKKLQHESPDNYICPKCPDCVCPSCPSEEAILKKYGFLNRINTSYNPPIPVTHVPQFINSTQYQTIGYLHKLNVTDDKDKYKILPVFGKQHRGGFFKYYTQFMSGGQPFRKLIIKPPSSNRDYSRELYDGDKITLDGPLDSTFEFKEEKLDNRIDLFDENPFNPFPY